MVTFSRYNKDVCYFTIFTLLLTYITIRAVQIPISVDEGCTILSQVTKDPYEIVSFEKDSSINNHIFNTLSIKFLLWITNMNSAFLTRLPNILAFCLGFFCAVKLLKKVSENSFWITCTGITFIFCNPYFLDFCGLARGYGMSVNFAICSIYFTYKYLIDNQLKNLIISLLWASLGVYANFSAEHFYAALVIYLFLHLFFTKDIAQKWQHIGVIFGISFALLLLIIKPLLAVTKANQLQYFGHTNFYHDTVKTLVGCSLHETKYLAQGVFDPNSTVLIVLYLIIFLFVCLLLRKRVQEVSKNTFLFFFGLLTLAVLSCNVQHYALGIAFMTNRTTLLFLPLFGFMVVGLLCHLYKNYPISRLAIQRSMLAIIGFSAVNLYKIANTKYAYEWWFDADTHNVYQDLKQEKTKYPDKLLYFGVHNLYQASFEYHRMTAYPNLVHPVLWLYNIPKNNEFEYLYVHQDIYPTLKEHYAIIAGYNTNERLLLKRKGLK